MGGLFKEYTVPVWNYEKGLKMGSGVVHSVMSVHSAAELYS